MAKSKKNEVDDTPIENAPATPPEQNEPPKKVKPKKTFFEPKF